MTTKTTTPKVTCPSCRRKQQDEGQRATCRYCGCSPLPSREYPAGHVFHPDRKPAKKRTPQP